MSVGLDERSLRLVHTADVAGTMEYTTLSYCWGEKFPLCTTTNMLAEFAQEIPSELMPATFADAIRITRAVGIPYIWIDALCIVQDDVEDWQREAAVMNKVYGGSQLTIAASQSLDSSTGCFPALDEAFKGQDTTFRGPGSLVYFYYDDVRIRPSSGNILSERAWTLQEQLLSPRTVFCLQPEMHWQCHQDHNIENGLSFRSTDDVERDDRLPMHIPRTQPRTEASFVQLRAAWERVVGNYSGRLLTSERDRVPAIAGVLHRFASVLHDDESIMGLWKATFARDMAWSRLWIRVQERGPGDPALPSWSWLACPGAATFKWWKDSRLSSDGTPIKASREPKDQIQLLGWNIQWSGVPYTSPLKSAYLEVEAPVMTIDMRPTQDQLSGKLYGYFQVLGENLSGSDSKLYRCDGYLDRGDLTAPASFPCMLLFTGRKEEDEGYEVFIIMEAVGPTEGNIFRRVGAARLCGTTPAFDIEKRMTITLV